MRTSYHFWLNYSNLLHTPTIISVQIKEWRTRMLRKRNWGALLEHKFTADYECVIREWRMYALHVFKRNVCYAFCFQEWRTFYQFEKYCCEVMILIEVLSSVKSCYQIWTHCQKYSKTTLRRSCATNYTYVGKVLVCRERVYAER